MAHFIIDKNGKLIPKTHAKKAPIKTDLSQALEDIWHKLKDDDFYEKDGKNYPKIDAVRDLLNMPDLKAGALFKALDNVKQFG